MNFNNIQMKTILLTVAAVLLTGLIFLAPEKDLKGKSHPAGRMTEGDASVEGPGSPVILPGVQDQTVSLKGTQPDNKLLNKNIIVCIL
jgi:hypothetical protein